MNQGHYCGYTPEDYIRLLDVLSIIKGKFLLSNYPSEVLSAYIQRNNRNVVEHHCKITANKSSEDEPRKEKIELLVANYPHDNVEERIRSF